MNKVKKVREFIAEFYKKYGVNKLTPYGKINNIIYSNKIVNNEKTDDLAIRFFVDKKIKANELEEFELIPSTFLLENFEILTDVDDEKLNISFLTDCFVLGGNDEPIRENYRKQRPLIGGCSSIYIGGTDATLGMLVRDTTDGSVVALSNNHVYTNSQFLAYDTASKNYNILSLQARQPGTPPINQYGSYTSSQDLIGSPKRFVPFDSNNVNIVDAAIVALTGYGLLDPLSSGKILNFLVEPPFKWATEEEIDELLIPGRPNYGSPLFKSGRTTGPLGSPGSRYPCIFPCVNNNCYSLCAFGIFSGGVSISQGSPVVYFNDCILYKSVNEDFVAGMGGDSGSAVFALLSTSYQTMSAWKFVGLNFAGYVNPSNTSPAVFIRADNIKNLLQIDSWDTTIPTLSSIPSFASITDTVYQSTSAVTLSGRKFYLVGKG